MNDNCIFKYNIRHITNDILFCFGDGEKALLVNTMTAEQFLLAFIRTELLMPERLIFEGENIYADILLPAMEQQQKARKKHTKKNKKGAMPIENI